ncbi:hypothetical protein C8J57DRAFT_1215953 [Mycena rebaudengoi]|nr:hypothetical protein C8J57DRAFT_1215953 [Mycena rebaudengoi]
MHAPAKGSNDGPDPDNILATRRDTGAENLPTMGKFGIIHLNGGDNPARWSHMAVLSNLTPDVKPVVLPSAFVGFPAALAGFIAWSKAEPTTCKKCNKKDTGVFTLHPEFNSPMAKRLWCQQATYIADRGTLMQPLDHFQHGYALTWQKYVVLFQWCSAANMLPAQYGMKAQDTSVTMNDAPYGNKIRKAAIAVWVEELTIMVYGNDPVTGGGHPMKKQTLRTLGIRVQKGLPLRGLLRSSLRSKQDFNGDSGDAVDTPSIIAALKHAILRFL